MFCDLFLSNFDYAIIISCDAYCWQTNKYLVSSPLPPPLPTTNRPPRTQNILSSSEQTEVFQVFIKMRERWARVRSAKFVNILDKKRLLLLINLTVFVSAEISPDSEQYFCRAQQHHHIPSPDRHRVQLHELPAGLRASPHPPGGRWLCWAISTVRGVPTIPADHAGSAQSGTNSPGNIGFHNQVKGIPGPTVSWGHQGQSGRISTAPLQLQLIKINKLPPLKYKIYTENILYFLCLMAAE